MKSYFKYYFTSLVEIIASFFLGISKDAEKDFASQQLTVGSHMADVCKSDLQINSNGNNELNIETEV